MTYVLDTNTISKVLKNDQKVTDKIKEIILSGETILVNCISYYEIKRGLLSINATAQIVRFDRFCNRFGLLFLDSLPILEAAAEIWSNLSQSGNLIEDADTLIASMVKTNQYTLVTDDGHFERVQDLITENWIN